MPPPRAADGVSNVRVGKAGDYFRGQDVENIVGHFFFINRLSFAMGALGGHKDGVLLGRNVQNDVYACHLTSSDAQASLPAGGVNGK